MTFTNNTNNAIYFLTLTSLLLLLISHEASSQQTLLAPLNKDTQTSLYTITLNSNERHVIDLSAPFSWRHCSSPRQHTVDCVSAQCIQAQYLLSPSCPISFTNPSPLPNPCTCMVTPINPRTKSCALDRLTSANLSISYVNREKPRSEIEFKNIYLSCARRSLFRSFPRGVVGLASLSLAPSSFPSQFSSSNFGVSQKFAICLPSGSSSSGVISFGDEPNNYFSTRKIDVLSLLSHTPLLRNPKTADYFIGIKELSVNGNYSIPMNPNEGIKLSTVVPYTTLRTDIFEKLLNFFTRSMIKGARLLKRVKPFSACYNASEIGYGRFGLNVPKIDLEFANGKNWTVHGANSMRRVGGEVACFAFLDGEANPEHSIVIGSFQMEDNLLLFDLEQMSFGFSSSLYSQRMTCGDFGMGSKV
ncbi:Eukaryotic aspartyl protease family protein [Striga hermonthica]|uniref:Eukaryotic aspartyl protease family protein n=1 Tax=Striga hermonthica TaxID=68872 RepID=A0A9N7R218_STRHE|nr:Eukaryotic aspartyl protease family protein [Striga hermonthica]